MNNIFKIIILLVLAYIFVGVLLSAKWHFFDNPTETIDTTLNLGVSRKIAVFIEDIIIWPMRLGKV